MTEWLPFIHDVLVWGGAAIVAIVILGSIILIPYDHPKWEDELKRRSEEASAKIRKIGLEEAQLEFYITLTAYLKSIMKTEEPTNE